MIVRNIPRKLLFIALVTAVSAGVYLLLLSATGQRAPGTARTDAFVMLPNAFQLIPKADVRERGVKIGDISSVDFQLTDGGVISKIGVSLEPKYEIYKNATVRLRTKTLANENYVELDRGTAGAGELAEGATLPMKQAQDTTQLDDIFATFDPETRNSIKTDLDAVGGGLQGRSEEINEILGASRPVGVNGRDVLGVLDEQRRQVGALIQDSSKLLQAFGNRAQAVRTLATQARSTAEAAASRDAQLAAAVRELPGTLRQARSTLANLGSFAERSTPVVYDLTGVTVDATPLLQDLGPTALATRELVGELPAALRNARPLVRELTPFSDRLKPAVVALDGVLRQANPLLAYLAPYAEEVAVFFADNGSAIGAMDAAGYIGRVFPIGGLDTLTGIPPEVKQALDFLEAAGGVGPSGTGQEYNPYPRPGNNANVQPFDGVYPRLRAQPKARAR